MADLKDIADVRGHAELRYSPWTPVTQPRLQGGEDGGAPTCSARSAAPT